jgi:hypothetical protein
MDSYVSSRVHRVIYSTFPTVSVPRGWTKDENRPLGINLQEWIPNRFKLRWSNARVASVKGKVLRKVSGEDQGDERERTTLYSFADPWVFYLEIIFLLAYPMLKNSYLLYNPDGS